MDQYPERCNNICDYSSLKAINTLLKEGKFLHVRNMIRVKTPFGQLLKMDHKLSIRKFVALNAVRAWNGRKLVYGMKEYEIDEKLVTKSLNLSITGNRIIEPSNENHVPIFIKKAIPEMGKDRKKFNSLVVNVFRLTHDVEIISEPDEVIKLSKLYIALIFSALLFPKRQRIPLEYFYLLDDSHFDNLKLYNFDSEVARFLRNGIQTAKNAKTRSASVSGCLHIIEHLYGEEKLPIIHTQSKRARGKENEAELDESSTDLDTPLSFKKPRSDTGKCSKEYNLKKEPQSENPKTEIINIEDDSSEEDDDEEYDEEVTDDEVQLDPVHKSFMTVKRETIEEVTSSLGHMGPGQPFKGQHSCDWIVLNDGKWEDVGGFRVRTTQAQLYKQIWLKYGHIASNNVLTDSYAQVPVVSGIMTTITHMHYSRFSELTSDMIEVWEQNIKNAEKVEFNIQWVREWLEDFKKYFFEKKKHVAAYTQQDELLQTEMKKSIAAKNAWEEAERNIAALKANMSPLIKERQKYEEKDGHLLSRGWLAVV